MNLAAMPMVKMNETALSHFWDLVGWTLALNVEAVRSVVTLPQGILVALVIVLVAGLSQAIAQAVILFVNQVKPIRFIFSLLINAVLFVAGFFFLVVSTWLITLLPWTLDLSFGVLITVLGISYAPLVFSMLGALPYLGVPMLTLLSVWHLLAMVMGLSAIANVRLGVAFGYVAVGWIVLQILQNTIGQPIADFGSRLANAVAGVDLATDRRDVLDMVRHRMDDASLVWKEELRERLTSLRRGNIVDALGADELLERDRAGRELELKPPLTMSDISVEPLTRQAFQPPSRGNERTLKTILGLMGIAILTLMVVILLQPVREWVFDRYNHLPGVVQFLIDVAWIAIVSFVVAGLLAPLETLGWWAGWYSDEIDVTINAGELATPVSDTRAISRYVVFLDGIGKSTFEYLPDIEEFLNALTPILPDDIALVRGIMPYSVINNPLDEDRPLAFLWKLADQARLGNPASLMGLLINIRNILIVGVSADKRYGPIYNQGIAQVVYNGLINNGYRPESGTPITFMGYSGGGQMACACAPFLKRALNAPIDVISLGGVISGNCNILQLEHLYHLVGQRDRVERIGPIMFPGRWGFFPLSYWNRAKRRGKISLVSMGDIGHQVPGGLLDPDLMLPDGRTALQQTLDDICAILQGELLSKPDLSSVKSSNYDRYQQAPFTRPGYYPIHQPIALDWYRPIAPWMGRLILPDAHQRSRVKGALIEIYHAPDDYRALIGQTVMLRWSDDSMIQRLTMAVTKDVHFSAEAEYTSKYGGLVHPDRLNHWRQVHPLESLAGSRPVDDVVVLLKEPVEVVKDAAKTEDEGFLAIALCICSTPVQITGRFYGLVKFLEPVGGDQYRVQHFNRDSRQFDGLEEVVSTPYVVADQNGCFPSTHHDLERSPLNEAGWYIYGALNQSGQFVVQSLAPRALLQLQPHRVLFGEKAAYDYIRNEAWADIEAQKGRVSSVLCTSRSEDAADAVQAAIQEWQDQGNDVFPEGTRALVLHTYGGIGGARKEPAAAAPIFFGHFAFGIATVIHEPLADELCFDICYHQVYTHNTDGLIAGTLHWSRYMGDRQFGWAGVRPVCDILVKLDAFTGYYDFHGELRSPLTGMLGQLQAMTARYRIGDGTGGTYVGAANNCAQDSNQALFASIQQTRSVLQANADWLRDWAEHYPDQAERFQELIELEHDLRLELQPLGKPRADWEKREFNLGSTLEDEPLRNLIVGLSSWRTLLPRKASDTIVKIFLKHGASVWVLRTNQIGGSDPDVEPIAPITI